MKNIKTLLSVILTLVLAFSSVSNVSAADSWRTAYKKFLKDHTKLGIEEFKGNYWINGDLPLAFLYDFDKDGTPELIMRMAYIGSELGSIFIYEYDSASNSVSKPSKYNSKLEMRSTEGFGQKYNIFDLYTELKEYSAQKDIADLFKKSGFEAMVDEIIDNYSTSRSASEALIPKAYNHIDNYIDGYVIKPIMTPINAKITVNGSSKSFSKPVYAVNGRQLYPLREFAETVGAGIAWDAPTKTITCTASNNTVTFVVDSSSYKVNGAEKQMDDSVTPIIVDGSTYIPIRYAAEGLGYNVNWNSSTFTVEISKAQNQDVSTSANLDILSYLPKANTLYELSDSGVISGSGEDWSVYRVMEYEETGGKIYEKIISAIDGNGKSVNSLVGRTHVYYEDENGLYSSESSKNQQLEPRIKYPLTVGEKFQSEGFYGTATVRSINETVTTAAGVFDNVVVVNYEYGEGGYGETQYFAPGIGLIKYEAVRSGGEIVKITSK